MTPETRERVAREVLGWTPEQWGFSNWLHILPREWLQDRLDGWPGIGLTVEAMRAKGYGDSHDHTYGTFDTAAGLKRWTFGNEKLVRSATHEQDDEACALAALAALEGER